MFNKSNTKVTVNTLNRPDRRADRRYLVSNVSVSVIAPKEILDVLDVTMVHVPVHHQAGQVSLSVTLTETDWNVVDDVGVVLSLPASTPRPEVAGALTTAIVERVALLTPAALVTGVFVAKNDFALAIVGEDWGSSIAIALHLSLRGWSIVTPRHAFVDPNTREIEPFSKLLYIPSRIIPLLPVQYRRALEASPWYAIGSELGFYGVDPFANKRGSTEPIATTLRASLIVDSSRRELLGSVHEPAHTYVGAYLPFSDVGLASASLVLGAIVPTTDAVERWVGSLLAVAV